MKKAIGLAAIILAAASAARAADDALSHYAASYLLTAPSVRALGMGNAFVAAADDSQAIFYNPAGLAALRSPELGSMLAPQGLDQTLWAIEYANPLGTWGGAGAGVVMQQIGGIEGRQNEFDVPLSINSREGTGFLSYGYAPLPNLAFGLTGKYMFQSFTNIPDRGHGAAIDVGARCYLQSMPEMTFGVAAQNIGGRFSWSTGKTDPVLFLVKTGAAWQASRWLTLAGETEFRGDRSVRLHAGVEAAYSLFVLRAGADHDKPTLGFGVVTPPAKLRFKFDYAFEIDPKGLNDVSRFGFSWRF